MNIDFAQSMYADTHDPRNYPVLISINRRGAMLECLQELIERNCLELLP